MELPALRYQLVRMSVRSDASGLTFSILVGPSERRPRPRFNATGPTVTTPVDFRKAPQMLAAVHARIRTALLDWSNAMRSVLGLLVGLCTSAMRQRYIAQNRDTSFVPTKV